MKIFCLLIYMHIAHSTFLACMDSLEVWNAFSEKACWSLDNLIWKKEGKPLETLPLLSVIYIF